MSRDRNIKSDLSHSYFYLSSSSSVTDAGVHLLKNLSFIERDLWRTYTTS